MSKNLDTHRMVSTRGPVAAHLARWKYADPSGRIVYRDAQAPASESLRLIRPPDGVEHAPAPKTEPAPAPITPTEDS